MKEPIDTPAQWAGRTWDLVSDGEQVRLWRVEGRPSTLQSYRLTEKIERPGSPGELLESIERAMANSGNRYNRCTAWMSSADRNPVATRRWEPLDDDESEEDDGRGTDAPARGHMVQSLHHSRAMFRLTMGSMDGVMRYMSDENEQLRKRLRVLEGRELETMVITQKLLDRKAEREIEVGDRHAMSKGLEAGIGIVQSKFLGAPKDGEKGAALVSTLESFGASLTPEQQGRLEGILRPEQLMAFVGLLQPSDEAKADARATPETDSKDAKALPPAPHDRPTREQLRAWKANLSPENYDVLVKTLAAAKQAAAEPVSESEPEPEPEPASAPHEESAATGSP